MSVQFDHPPDHILLMFVSGDLNPPEADDIRTHIEGCRVCAATVSDLSAMDGLLRGLPGAPLPEGFVDRVRARLFTTTARNRPWRQWVAAAAVFGAAGGAIGWTAARSTAPAAIVRNVEGTKFALMFAEDPDTWIGVPAAERGRRLEEFMVWLRSIGDASIRLGGTQLDDGRGRIVGASLPVTAPNLVLSGFIVIRASTYDEAAAHAERCPILARGGQVIVRQLR